jgi:ABC-type molybdate transport system substrate-binding protein
MLRSVCALTAMLVLCMAGAYPAAARQPYVFTVPPVDQVLDLHGNPRDPQLAIFMAGNQYMVMPALLAAFRRAHPEIRSIYYETLPPGVDARQIAAGALQMGNLVIDTQADVFLSGRRRMLRMHEEGYVSSSFPYASNVLAIMVRKGNAKHVESLRDLGRADVRVSMPNARWEGVEEQIEQAYRKAGGEALVNAIMRRKLAAGTTMLTSIHHRQTPFFIRDGLADAGPVWISEALYQERIGSPLAFVRIPAADNVTAAYMAGMLRSAPHPRAAQAFLAFLKTPEAQRIFRSYGFGPPR